MAIPTAPVQAYAPGFEFLESPTIRAEVLLCVNSSFIDHVKTCNFCDIVPDFDPDKLTEEQAIELSYLYHKKYMTDVIHEISDKFKVVPVGFNALINPDNITPFLEAHEKSLEHCPEPVYCGIIFDFNRDAYQHLTTPDGWFAFSISYNTDDDSEVFGIRPCL